MSESASKPKIDNPGRCFVCGCTEDRACFPPCSWAEKGLCTTCAEFREQLKAFLSRSEAPLSGIARLYTAIGGRYLSGENAKQFRSLRAFKKAFGTSGLV